MVVPRHSSLSRACLRPHLIDNVPQKRRHPSGTSAVDVDRWCRFMKNGMSVGRKGKEDAAVRTPVRTSIFRTRQTWMHKGWKRKITVQRGLVRRRRERHPIKGYVFAVLILRTFSANPFCSVSKLVHYIEGANVSSASPQGLTCSCRMP